MQAADTDRRFAERIEFHRGILFKVCNLYGATHEDREDLAQEILVQLWRAFPTFDGRCMFSTWMYRVALNTAISWLRHDTLRRRHLEPAEERMLISLPAKQVDSDELCLLYHLIDGLDAMQKAMMMLYLDGNSHQEIADVLGIATGTVMSRLYRARALLMEKLADLAAEQGIRRV